MICRKTRVEERDKGVEKRAQMRVGREKRNGEDERRRKERTEKRTKRVRVIAKHTIDTTEYYTQHTQCAQSISLNTWTGMRREEDM